MSQANLITSIHKHVDITKKKGNKTVGDRNPSFRP